MISISEEAQTREAQRASLLVSITAAREAGDGHHTSTQDRLAELDRSFHDILVRLPSWRDSQEAESRKIGVKIENSQARLFALERSIRVETAGDKGTGDDGLEFNESQIDTRAEGSATPSSNCSRIDSDCSWRVDEHDKDKKDDDVGQALGIGSSEAKGRQDFVQVLQKLRAERPGKDSDEESDWHCIQCIALSPLKSLDDLRDSLGIFLGKHLTKKSIQRLKLLLVGKESEWT